jgi:hypothetical protein
MVCSIIESTSKILQTERTHTMQLRVDPELQRKLIEFGREHLDEGYRPDEGGAQDNVVLLNLMCVVVAQYHAACEAPEGNTLDDTLQLIRDNIVED